MDREELIESFLCGGIQTKDAARVWGVSKATARARLLKIPGLTGTNTNTRYTKTGHVDGRFIDTIWQTPDCEDREEIAGIVDVILSLK